MAVLDRSDLMVPQVARRLGLARQSVQRVVDMLVMAELAQTTSNPDHLRSPLVHLTDTGRQALRAMEDMAQARYEQAAAKLSPSDVEASRRALRALIDAA
jgi:DNA-binding MarR family transcriptional regulator